jgi:hypothetical protein
MTTGGYNPGMELLWMVGVAAFILVMWKFGGC